MAGSSLLVGVDVSEEAQRALTTALQLAHRLGAAVVVVHAVGLLEEGGYRSATPVEDLVAAARSGSSVDVSGVPVEVLREDGPAADVLVRVAERVDAAMLIVGHRGAGGAVGALGSVSEAVLAHATTPVLVVPPAR